MSLPVDLADRETGEQDHRDEERDEWYCARCHGGPYQSELGLKQHTTRSHGAHADPIPSEPDACCSGATKLTPGTDREYCADCGLILDGDGHPQREEFIGRYSVEVSEE